MHIFSGLYKGRKVLTPKGEITRPTSGRLREALFNICREEICGARFLDLFAGSGAMGLEALSRGACQSTFVDNSKESIRCIRANALALNVEEVSEVIQADVFDAMKKLSKKGAEYDLIYADPPYEKMIKGVPFNEQVVSLLDDLIDADLPLLKKGGSLFVEDALPQQEKKLKHLILKGTRQMGRSTLQRWEYAE